MSNKDEIAVVIVAAGRGERAGTIDGPKQYRMMGGKTVLSHTIKAFVDDTRIGRIVVVRHVDDAALYHQSVQQFGSRIQEAIGGGTRQISTLNGLESLRQEPPDFVLIHDAARPFVDVGVLDRVIKNLNQAIGVIPALAVSDTLKRATSDTFVAETVSRADLFAVQTPQGFAFDAILAAHQRAASEAAPMFTDDASIAEWSGLPVRMVQGSPDNIKLTWQRDIEMADQKLNTMPRYPDVRIGTGYDVHSFVPGHFVTLAGVEIAHGAALNGHSDSDVALHALTDALLATCGAGDIGTHFPPTDMKWKGAASRIFLEHAASIIQNKNGRIANVDITLICEAPKIGPHREAMVAAIAGMINISTDRISVKATTNEKLGFIGRQEGIAAIASASVVFPGELQ